MAYSNAPSRSAWLTSDVAFFLETNAIWPGLVPGPLHLLNLKWAKNKRNLNYLPMVKLICIGKVQPQYVFIPLCCAQLQVDVEYSGQPRFRKCSCNSSGARQWQVGQLLPGAASWEHHERQWGMRGGCRDPLPSGKGSTLTLWFCTLDLWSIFSWALSRHLSIDEVQIRPSVVSFEKSMHCRVG